MPARGETGPFADVRWRDETGSTNADVLALARSGAPEGVVVATRFQRSGRGRHRRTWVAPPGTALLASVLLRPDLGPEAAQLATMAAALAGADACREVAGVEPALKWPNDLVVEDARGAMAKLAGLLGESLVEGERLAAVVVGMGCNLTAAPAGAVDLQKLAGRGIEAGDLLASWLEHLRARYPTASRAGALLDDYRPRCATLGRTVRVELADEVLEGQAVDVTVEGHLVVESAAGRRTVVVGDVVHLRGTLKDRGPSPPGSRTPSSPPW